MTVLPPASTATRQALVLHADPQPVGTAQFPRSRYAHPRITVEERSLGPLAPGAIRVAPLMVALCGTDVHAVTSDPATGRVVSSAPMSVGPEGRVLGHETVARVIDVGANVRGIEPGMAVALESILHCRRCDPCRRGRFNQCTSSALLGMEVDGVFATVADVPAEIAHDVTDLARGSDLRAAALIEPAACALRALYACRIRAGAEVAVFGAGPIGAFAAMLARVACGAAAVHLIEPEPYRRSLGARFADRCVDVDEFFRSPPGRGLDAVVEASGALGNVERVMRLMAPGARIALLARCGQPLAVDAVDHMITNDVSIVGSRGHLGGAFADVLRLVRAGALPLADVVTAVVDGLDGLAAMLAAPERIATRQCKVLARLAAWPGGMG